MQRALLVMLAALVVAAPLLAGCASTTETSTTPTAPAPFDPAVLSPKSLQVLAPEEVWVTATDGAHLDNAVYRPQTDEKVPVFINFSPYWGDTAMARGDAFANYTISEYAPRGYAVVLSALRGTGHSEGCFQIGGDLEIQDAFDVIDYFSKQPWSNGKVAAGGKSYDSTTQNGLIAKKPHPALRGIFHVSGITDMYRYNAKDGVVYRNGLDFTPSYFLTQGLDEYVGATNGAGSAQDESPASLMRLAGDVACPEAPKHLASGEGTAADGMRDAYWQERDWPAFLRDSSWNGSVFFVHGLQDWNVKADDIDPWVDILQAKGIHVLGWLHQETFNGGHVYPMRQDWNETMLRWLDGTLKGVDTHLGELWGFDVAGSDGTWRHSGNWPPPTTGELVWDASAPSPDRSSWPADIRVAGMPYAKVTVTAKNPDDIARIVLWDQGPDGKSVFVGEAVRRIALSDDLSAPRPATGPVELNMTFYPVDHELLPKHGWFVELGPSTTDTPQGETTPPDFFFRPDQVSQVTYGKVEIHLPLADSGGALQPQPLHMRCFTC